VYVNIWRTDERDSGGLAPAESCAGNLKAPKKKKNVW